MSCQPRCSHSSRRPNPSTRSRQARAHRPGLGGGVGERHGVSNLSRLPMPAQPNPLGQPARVAAGHQEVPAEPQPLLRQQLAQARLRQQVAAVAVGEEPLGRVVGVLGVHPPAEDRLELVGAAAGADRPRPGRCRTADPSAPAGGAVPPRRRGRTAADPARRRPPRWPRGTARR